MATATAVWSPLCASADLAHPRSRSDAVSRGDTVSSCNIDLPGRSDNLLYHAGRRPFGENQREHLCATQDKVMDRLCGQLQELLKRVGVSGPSPAVLHPQRDGVTQFNVSSSENGAGLERSRDFISRGSAGVGTPEQPSWVPLQRGILDAKSHNAGMERDRGGKGPASEAPQRRRGSPEVDHFFKTKICPFIKGGGICLRNNACTFAHSMDELRPQPSFRKTKLCRYSNAGQVCSRGENCSFAHSVRELKPLQVPPYRRKHQAVSFQSNFASAAVQAAATFSAAATAHSQESAPGSVFAGIAPHAPAAGDCAAEGRFLENKSASSGAQGGGPWQGKGNVVTTSKTGHAPNSGGCGGSSSYHAQQQLLYSDLRRLSEATLGSLLASVQEKGCGPSFSGAEPTPTRATQKPQHSGGPPLPHEGERHFCTPPDRHTLHKYAHPRTPLSPPASTASSTARSLPRVSPPSAECTLQPPRQEAHRLQGGLEATASRLPCVQQKRAVFASRDPLNPSPEHQHTPDEEHRRVRFAADGCSVQEQQRKAPTTLQSNRQGQQAAAFPETSAAATVLAGASRNTEQEHTVAAGAAAAGRALGEDRLRQKKPILAVGGDSWSNRGCCRSSVPGVCNNANTRTSGGSPVPPSVVEADSLCHPFAAGRAVKKSRRGKRGGRKKRGAGNLPSGSSSTEQLEKQYSPEVQQSPEKDAGREQQPVEDNHGDYGDRACNSSTSCKPSDRFLLDEVDAHEVIKSLLQRAEGSAASTCLSEGTPSTSRMGDRCSATCVFSAGSNSSGVEGDVFSHILLDPKCGEGTRALEDADEQQQRNEKQSAQLLLEALQAHVAAAVGENVGRTGRPLDAEEALPPVLLPAAPASLSVPHSSSSRLAPETLLSGRRDFTGEGKERKDAAASFVALEEEADTTAAVCCGQRYQSKATAETPSPQQILTELLLHGEEAQQLLLLQCIRDIMNDHTPPATAPSSSELLSALQLLGSTSFSSDDTSVAADITPALAGGAAGDAARRKAVDASATPAGHESGQRGVQKRCLTEDKKVCPTDERRWPPPLSFTHVANNAYASFAEEFDYNGLPLEKEALNDRRNTTAVAADLASCNTAAGAAVASILELLTDEEEGPKTASATVQQQQQQASTRSSSRCGMPQEEAGGAPFGGPATTEAGQPTIHNSVGGNRTGGTAALASQGYVSGFFTPDFAATATTSGSLSPWL